MKKIVSFLFILFTVFLFSQEGIQFQNSSFQELLAKAKKENKLLFIDAMAVWCGPCKMMDKNVFPKKKIGEFYNANFINAKFDMEKGEGRDIASKYGVNSYPTYLFINGDGQLVSRNMGGMSEDLFLELGKEASSANKNFGSMRERFDKGEKDPQFLMTIIKLHGKSDPEFAQKASERYFQNKKNKEFTQEEAGYLLGFIKSVDDKNYAIFQENKTQIYTLFPPEQLNSFDNGLKMQKIIDTSLDDTTKTIKEAYFLENATKIIGEEGAKVSLQRLKINYYEKENNYPLYEKAVLDYFKNPENADPKELLKAAKNVSEKSTDKQALKSALQWAEKSVMVVENPESTLVLAKLYLQNGKKEEAQLFAERSLELHTKMQLDSSEIQAFIKKMN